MSVMLCSGQCNNRDSNLDLLTVVDDRDIIKLHAKKMQGALLSVNPRVMIGITSMLYSDVFPDDVTCKKILFITWGSDADARKCMVRWLGKFSRVGSDKKRRFVIEVTKDAGGKSLPIVDNHTDLFCVDNRLKINSIKEVETWWPQILQFYFVIKISTNGKYWYDIQQLSNVDEHSKSKDVLKSGLDHFKMTETKHQDRSTKCCNIVITNGGQDKPNLSSSNNNNTIVLFDNTSRVDSLTKQQCFNKSNLMVCLLWILVKVGIVSEPWQQRVYKRLRDFKSTIIASFQCMVDVDDFDYQGYFIFAELLSCTFATGLPYWWYIHFDKGITVNGRIIEGMTGSMPYGSHVKFGLFLTCDDNDPISADQCSRYSKSLPVYWRVLQVFSILSIAFYFFGMIGMCMPIEQFHNNPSKKRCMYLIFAIHAFAGTFYFISLK